MSLLRRLLAQLPGRGTAPGAPAVAGSRGPGRAVEPSFALYNKMYREPPFDDPARREALLKGLREAAQALGPNRPGGHAFLADEMLV